MIQITMNNDTMKYGQKQWNLDETLLGRARPLAHCIFIVGSGFTPRVQLHATPLLTSCCVLACSPLPPACSLLWRRRRQWVAIPRCCAAAL